MDVRGARRLGKLSPTLYVRLRERVRAARASGIDVISLGVGDPDGETPPHVVDALARASADRAHQGYPVGESRGTPEFREAVAAWYARRFGVELDPAGEVLALIGSKEGSHHLALGLLDPGDLALVPDPAYPIYEASAIIAGAEVIRVPMRAADSFLMDLDRIPVAQARRARLLWISYPNNPTTAAATLGFFRRVVEFARRHDLVVVNDNPYSEIAFDGFRPPSILQVEGAKEVAVEFNSLSKAYNMAGWRIGAAVGDRRVIGAMERIKQNTDSGPFAALQRAAVAALTGPQDVIAGNVARYQRRRDLVVETWRGIGLDVTEPKATFYVWAAVAPGVGSADFAARMLDLTGVVVTPGIGYGGHGEGYVRLSLGAGDAELWEAMTRIRKAAGPLLDPPGRDGTAGPFQPVP